MIRKHLSVVVLLSAGMFLASCGGNNEEMEKLKNLSVLVVNALREEPHATHFNLEEALAFITLVQPKKAYLTHISHLLGFHDEVQQKLPKNVYLAYDNLEISI